MIRYIHLISSQSIDLDGRRGTIDDVLTILFHLSQSPLPSGNLQTPFLSIPLSSRLFCLPFLIALFTVVFAMPEDLEMWPYHLSFRFFTMVRRSLCTVANPLVCHMVFVGNVQKSSIASHLKGVDPSLEFCCQGPALTDIRECG